MTANEERVIFSVIWPPVSGLYPENIVPSMFSQTAWINTVTHREGRGVGGGCLESVRPAGVWDDERDNEW